MRNHRGPRAVDEAPGAFAAPGGFQLVAGGDLNPRPPRYESDQGSRNWVARKVAEVGIELLGATRSWYRWDPRVRTLRFSSKRSTTQDSVYADKAPA